MNILSFSHFSFFKSLFSTYLFLYLTFGFEMFKKVSSDSSPFSIIETVWIPKESATKKKSFLSVYCFLSNQQQIKESGDKKRDKCKKESRWNNKETKNFSGIWIYQLRWVMLVCGNRFKFYLSIFIRFVLLFYYYHHYHYYY